MKIGFNIKKIQDMIADFVETFYQVIILPDMQTINNKCEWLEITSGNGQEAEITQGFSEIRLLAKCTNANYSVTYNYDETIFHNTQGNADTYMICGNPTENNFGCKFKYMLSSDNKQYVCVDSCFSGGGYDASEFRAWIKPTNTPY